MDDRQVTIDKYLQCDSPRALSCGNLADTVLQTKNLLKRRPGRERVRSQGNPYFSHFEQPSDFAERIAPADIKEQVSIFFNPKVYTDFSVT